MLNNGVYRAGFATKQSAYDKAVAEVFEALDRVENILAESKGKFLTGDDFTWLDLRLYHTLVRYVLSRRSPCSLPADTMFLAMNGGRTRIGEL
eukprot:scaffold51535_cov32-Tisochrysis_lutea.AAC.3